MKFFPILKKNSLDFFSTLVSILGAKKRGKGFFFEKLKFLWELKNRKD